MNEQIKTFINKAISSISTSYKSSGIIGLIKNTYFIGLLCTTLGLTIIASCGSSSKYSIIVKDKDAIQTMMKIYKDEIVSNSAIYDYCKLIVNSPDELYEIMRRDNCNKEVLEFIDKNRKFVYVVFNISIVSSMKNITEAELVYVTNYIKSPTAAAATNAAEMAIEEETIKAMYLTYRMYKEFKKSEVIKDLVEEMILGMYNEKKNN